LTFKKYINDLFCIIQHQTLMGTYANMFAKIVFINQERKSDVQGQSETSLGWPKAASKPLFLRNAGLFTIRE
jgi:hypothetical protein